ncbi:MAG: hypothetical protein KDK91_33055 [Gammaproteobacteria bacterium]|nr:hypothetical protein [Gammaproteobacteria bacterium]
MTSQSLSADSLADGLRSARVYHGMPGSVPDTGFVIFAHDGRFFYVYFGHEQRQALNLHAIDLADFHRSQSRYGAFQADKLVALAALPDPCRRYVQAVAAGAERLQALTDGADKLMIGSPLKTCYLPHYGFVRLALGNPALLEPCLNRLAAWNDAINSVVADQPLIAIDEASDVDRYQALMWQVTRLGFDRWSPSRPTVFSFESDGHGREQVGRLADGSIFLLGLEAGQVISLTRHTPPDHEARLRLVLRRTAELSLRVEAQRHDVLGYLQHTDFARLIKAGCIEFHSGTNLYHQCLDGAHMQWRDEAERPGMRDLAGELEQIRMGYASVQVRALQGRALQVPVLPSA